MQKHRFSFIAIAVAAILVIMACNTTTTVVPSVPPTSVPPTTEAGIPPVTEPIPSVTAGISYISMPSDPLTIAGRIDDPVFPSNEGDNHNADLYERPFQLDSIYRFDADIVFAFLADDGDWYYFSTQMVDVSPIDKMMDTSYGAEIDTDRDGRGDFLIWATPPYSTDWTKANVQVFTDTNKDVGGPRPLLSDAPYNGNGYETMIFDRGTGADIDTAWVRQAPKDIRYLEIAIKKTTVVAKSFLWGVWTDFGTFSPATFDFNDYYTAAQAGSPFAANPNFPIKQLYGMDNTCRAAYGFTPTGKEPGLCGATVPQPTTVQQPGVTKQPGVTPVVPPPCSDIQITAQAHDSVGGWNSGWSGDILFCLVGVSCQNPDGSGYAAWIVPAGTYTVTGSSKVYRVTPSEATTTRGCGEKDLISFLVDLP